MFSIWLIILFISSFFFISSKNFFDIYLLLNVPLSSIIFSCSSFSFFKLLIFEFCNNWVFKSFFAITFSKIGILFFGGGISKRGISRHSLSGLKLCSQVFSTSGSKNIFIFSLFKYSSWYLFTNLFKIFLKILFLLFCFYLEY